MYINLLTNQIINLLIKIKARSTQKIVKDAFKLNSKNEEKKFHMTSFINLLKTV